MDSAAKHSDAAPLFAVVTPVYNGARYLAETMDCVQAQTYPNLVHIVLDNASTDETPAIIARYLNARVPVITARNPETIPVVPNWEAALKLIPPEAAYFRILCADDKMTPDAVEQVVAIGLAHPNVGVIGCGYQVMDAPQASQWPEGVAVIPGKEAVRRVFQGEGQLIGPHLTFRADLLKLRDPFYDASCNANDAEACFLSLQHSDWANTQAILGWTRVHNESITHKFMHRRGAHFREWLVFLRDYGAWAMDAATVEAHRKAYLRYYLRRLMIWRFQPYGAEKFKTHVAFLREMGHGVGPLAFLDAFVDLALKRLKLRPPPPRSGHPLG